MWVRDPNLLLAGFYWPLLDILIWGFLGSWIQQSQTALPNYEAVALLGILLWQVVGRGCNVMGFSLCEELWSYNIVNLFSLPISIMEWILGIVLFTALMVGFTFAISIILIALLYKISIFYLITTFMLFVVPLFFSALWLGFTCLQVVVLFGRRGVELGFVIGWFFLPFTGAYYPIDVLPLWAQKISALVPMSYVFQGMRSYVMYGKSPTQLLIWGYTLSIVYTVIAILLFIYCFNRSKRKGLARLVN